MRCGVVHDAKGHQHGQQHIHTPVVTVTTLDAAANFEAICLPEGDALLGVTWSSSNPAVATVDKNGKVTPVKSGSTVVKATAADGSGQFASFTFTVNCSPETVTISGANSIAVGKKVTLTASVGPDGVASQAVTWAFDAGSTCATVGAITGVVAANNATANIGKKINLIATTQAAGAGGNKIVSEPFTLTVTSPTTGIATNLGIGSGKTTAYLYQEQLQLYAVCQPESASQSVVWSTGDAKIATVNATTGLVTLVKTGTVSITATAMDGTGVKNITTLTIQ